MIRPRKLAFFLLALVVVSAAAWFLSKSHAENASSTESKSEINRPDHPRIIVISIDGLRPDLLLLADAPVLHGMMKTGSYSMWAQTTAVAITLPSHVSMLTGVPPNEHGIDWNRDFHLEEPIYPAVPTYFELAKQAGYTTGMVSGKEKFELLNKPGTIDWCIIPKSFSVKNTVVEQNAIEMITSHKPEAMFVHFADVDGNGHEHGWSSKEQMSAITDVDRSIGSILNALSSAGVREQTLIIVSSDHGGAGYNHGADDVRSRCIPWIVNGPNVKPNTDLTLADSSRIIKTEDTFATSMWWLKIALPERCEGKPVQAAFEVKASE